MRKFEQVATHVNDFTHTQLLNMNLLLENGFIITGSYLVNQLEMLYSSFYGKDIVYSFFNYVMDNKNSLERILNALYKEYDITNNYDKTSEISVDTAKIKSTVHTPELTTQTKTATFDTSEKDVDTITNNENTITTESYTDEKLTDSYNKSAVNITRERTYGNIGVTTNVQMIEAEMKLRFNSIIGNFISSYADIYLFYVGGDEDANDIIFE